MAQAHDKVRTLRREVRAVVHSYPEAKQKAKDATNSDAWGPSDEQKEELAMMAKGNGESRALIYKALWKRVYDDSNYWMHVSKALSVLEWFLVVDVPDIRSELSGENASHLAAIASSYDKAVHDNPVQRSNLNEIVQSKAAKLIRLQEDDAALEQEAETLRRVAIRMRQDAKGHAHHTTLGHVDTPSHHVAPPPAPAAAAAAASRERSGSSLPTPQHESPAAGRSPVVPHRSTPLSEVLAAGGVAPQSASSAGPSGGAAVGMPPPLGAVPAAVGRSPAGESIATPSNTTPSGQVEPSGPRGSQGGFASSTTPHQWSDSPSPPRPDADAGQTSLFPAAAVPAAAARPQVPAHHAGAPGSPEFDPFAGVDEAVGRASGSREPSARHATLESQRRTLSDFFDAPAAGVTSSSTSIPASPVPPVVVTPAAAPPPETAAKQPPSSSGSRRSRGHVDEDTEAMLRELSGDVQRRRSSGTHDGMGRPSQQGSRR